MEHSIFKLFWATEQDDFNDLQRDFSSKKQFILY